MLDWFKSISLKWKMQIVFFTVTLITTCYNRMLGAWQMRQQIQLVSEESGSSAMIASLEAQYNDFLWFAVVETSAQLIVQFLIIMLLARLFVQPILVLTKALKKTSQGDFTCNVTEHSRDEIGILERCFNEVLKTLNQLITQVHDSSLHTTQSAYQIASVTHEIEESSDMEAERSRQVNEATETLHKVSNQVIESAENTHEQAISSAKLSRQGIGLVKNIIAELNTVTSGIKEAANQTNVVQTAVESISSTLQEITSIAEQTNLLALNAAIEAARAGENGRGFAVVADEVRALSIRTSDSAGSVKGIIERLNKDMEQTQVMMSSLVDNVASNQEKSEQTKTLLGDMQVSTEAFVQASKQIFQDTTQQLHQFSCLEERLQGLFQTLKDNSIKVGNTSNIGHSLFNLTKKMEAQLSGLKFIPQPISETPEEIARLRAAPRTTSHLLVSIFTDKDRYEGLSKDISQTGIQITTKGLMNKGTKIKIAIKLPTDKLPDYVQQEPVQLDAEVMWKKSDETGDFSYGLQFLSPNTQQTAEIERCCQYYEKSATNF